jgi:hypothetical protein
MCVESSSYFSCALWTEQNEKYMLKKSTLRFLQINTEVILAEQTIEKKIETEILFMLSCYVIR